MPMNRLKVLVFALIALGLWVFNLTTLSSALSTRAVEQTSAPLLAASGAVAQRIEASRSAIQGAVLKLASNPVLLQKPSFKAEAPKPEQFLAIRTAAYEGLTDAARATAYLALVNEQGALMAFGNAEPTPAPEGFDAKAAAAGGGDGVLLDMNGTPCLFFSVPVVSTSQGEPKAVASVVLGTALWGSYPSVDALADSVNKDLNLSGLGLWMKGKLVGAAGKKDALEKAFKDAKPGQTSVVERGTVSAMGPLKLPMFVGSANALDVAARKDIPGTPFEVVAIASARPFMEALASAQKISLLLLLGLIAAGVVFTLLVSQGGAADEEEEEDAAPKRMSVPPPLPAAAAASASGANGAEPKTRAERVEPLPGTLTGQPATSEASPDDFHFPPPPEKAAPPSPPPPPPLPGPAAFDGPAEDPFASAGPPAPSHAVTVQAPASVAPPPLSLADDDYDNQRTTAYPAHRMPSMDSTTDAHAAVDPFALAGGPSDGQGPEFNPDATRVAAIPPELLKSARRDSGPTAANPAFRAAPPPPPVAAPRVQSVSLGGGDEEQHFQETFRDFLSTRQKCGEANDGMTYDKFAAKLRKNKEQLVAKYNCRTVRFQVYVKDGKAALKATPVKD
jgi:hypothetical protein